MINLRILINEQVICTDTLNNYQTKEETVGFELKNRIQYYSNLPVSSIKDFKLIIDGKKVEKNNGNIFLWDKCFNLSQLNELYTKYWYFLDKAKLIFDIPAGLSKEGHEIDLKFEGVRYGA